MALTRGRRPRGRAHVDACEGHHMAGKAGRGGPTGIVGPLLEWGAVMLIKLHWRSPYLTAHVPPFYSVWDYVPTEFLFCR